MYVVLCYVSSSCYISSFCIQITSLTSQLQETSVKTEELMRKNNTLEEEILQLKSELLAKVSDNTALFRKSLKKIFENRNVIRLER